MSFLERERRRLIELRDDIFGDPGMGLYAGQSREFVLMEATANLWDGIRLDAIDYFQRNGIRWHKAEADGPTGHMLSSQVACVNHLYLLRQRADLAVAVLRGVDPDVVEAEIVDDGYVEFEFIGHQPYLGERSFQRGAHCTSVDAFMIGRTVQGSRRAFLIEWKYTESNTSEDKYIGARSEIYDYLVTAAASPFNPIDPRVLYFEPYYQLMRQTLLAWQISEHADHGCTSYRHIHVVPAQNAEFHRNVTAPDFKLPGATVAEAWASVLKRPYQYIGLSPEQFMRPVTEARDARALTGYLRRRYWSGI
jgi:hypothetical protein